MSLDAPSGTPGVVPPGSWRRSRLCKFFHGKRGCLRKDCVFVHSIQTRVNELLDCEHIDSRAGVACLLKQGLRAIELCNKCGK